MPKKIEYPLSEGLIAKIYLNAFPDYITAYQVAKNIGVRPGQVTREINREEYSNLFNRKVEREKKKPIRSRAERFLAKLEKNLENNDTTLTKKERKQLKEYLGGPFRRATRRKYLNVNYDEPVNAYAKLLFQLSRIVAKEWTARFVAQEFKKIMPSATGGKRGLKGKTYELLEGSDVEKIWNDKEILEPVKEFPDGIFNKLATSDQLEVKGYMEDLKHWRRKTVPNFWKHIAEEMKDGKK
ncbi:hypothetical protein AKJ41_02070 [candidate division MSBL1 archaeon SCGC-AAA259O05]|uniref:Uncharacterized protein n=1 Tax=candidate division MSBL1 archaeon SCGC-AAA259O05 TaxID=1698271 RepID=A0A133V4H1_9EURY|nr:hypothetical protein AKJ41_02070 [candidate division MSBL1 archaeon SCGC-AAA259O05]